MVCRKKPSQFYKEYLKRSRILNWNWQGYLIKLFDNPLGRWYLGVPKGKRIYKITPTGCHYYTGEIGERNGLPIICTGERSPGQRDIITQKIMKLAGVISVFAFLPLFPKSLLPLIALTDTGLKSPTATGGKYNQWTNPTNAYSSNDSYATCSDTPGGEQSYETFGFSIPSDATINGIVVKLEAKCTGGSYGTMQGGIYDVSAGGWYRKVTGPMTTSDVIYTLGGSSDLWTGSWVPTDFSNANFSAELRLHQTGSGYTYSVDHIQVQVYYTPAVVLPTVTVQAVDQIEKTQARGNGNITDTGGENCTKRGFVYGTTSHVDPGNVAPGSSGYDTYVEDTGSFGTGAFTKTLINLAAGTRYYVRAYAYNSAGYDYSNTEVNFYTIFAKSITDSGGGAEATPSIKAKITPVDSGSGSDISSIKSKLSLSDSGQGQESPNILNKIGLQDNNLPNISYF